MTVARTVPRLAPVPEANSAQECHPPVIASSSQGQAQKSNVADSRRYLSPHAPKAVTKTRAQEGVDKMVMTPTSHTQMPIPGSQSRYRRLDYIF